MPDRIMFDISILLRLTRVDMVQASDIHLNAPSFAVEVIQNVQQPELPTIKFIDQTRLGRSGMPELPACRVSIACGA